MLTHSSKSPQAYSVNLDTDQDALACAHALGQGEQAALHAVLSAARHVQKRAQQRAQVRDEQRKHSGEHDQMHEQAQARGEEMVQDRKQSGARCQAQDHSVRQGEEMPQAFWQTAGHATAEAFSCPPPHRERPAHGPEMVTLVVEDLERAFCSIMSLQAILAKAGGSGVDLPADDVAYVLGALLHDAHGRIGHPRMAGDTL